MRLRWLVDLRVIVVVGTTTSLLVLALVVRLHDEEDAARTDLGPWRDESAMVSSPARTEDRDDIEAVLGVDVAWPSIALSECEVWTPRIVVYNRIPKCGSGSVTIFLSAAQAQNGFQLCRSTLYTQRWLNPSLAKAYVKNPFVASRCRKRVDLAAPAVLNRHVFFVDFAALDGQANVAYVNMLREPVSRCVSRFYYERDARGIVDADLTIDACIRSGTCRFQDWRATESVAGGHGGGRSTRWAQLREECASNYLTRWFCGHDSSRCNADAASLGVVVVVVDATTATMRPRAATIDDPRKAGAAKLMLETAARNVLQRHPAVGLVSKMSQSLELFARTVPSFFGGVNRSLFSVCNKCNPNRTTVTNPPPNDRHRALLARVNALDVALYAFAGDLLEARLAACGVPP